MLCRWFTEFVIILMTVKVNIDTDLLKAKGPYENKTAVHHTRFSVIALVLFWFNYRPQRSCGKVVFLHVSLILFTGGMGSLSGRPPRQRPPDRDPQTEISWTEIPGQRSPRQRPPDRDPPRPLDRGPQTETPWDRDPTGQRPPCTVTSRQYASYWNVHILVWFCSLPALIYFI